MRSIGKDLMVCAALALGLAMPAAGTRAQGAEPAPGSPAATATVTPLTPELAKSRARAVLERRCANCHQVEKIQGAAPASSFTNILALDDLAREPTLIEPGRPDASRLYHVMLSRHRPLGVLEGAGGSGAPSAEEIEMVRDWIETLVPLPEGCSERPMFTAAEAESLIQGWRRHMGAAAETRFVTLAHLSNGCLGERDLALYRDEAGRALASLAGRTEVKGVEAIGDLSVLLAVRLDEAGLKDVWDKLEDGAPRLIGGAVPADWLAHQANDSRSAALARRYREDVGVKRAAAERGVGQTALIGELGGIEGPDGKIARQLRQGLVTRAQWDHLDRVLRGLAPQSVPAFEGEPLRMGLWSDRTTYKAGDLATLTAIASKDCYLTLIGIDRTGNATVLYPNDFEHDNLLRGGSSITIPVQSATYQLRVKDPGNETAIGICGTVRRRPEGVLHEFERQRFTVLGNWRVFLATADRLEAEIARSDRGKAQRGAKAGEAARVPDAEARTAITFKVE